MEEQRVIGALVSDHGFGHAARMISILASLLRRGAKVIVVSAVPEWFFTQNLRGIGVELTNFVYILEKLTVGCYQKSGVEIDVEKTYDEVVKFWEKGDEKKQQIISSLQPHSPEMIIFDIPAIAPLVAKDLDIPSIGISNFGWNWIYESFIPQKPEFKKIVNNITKAYNQTTLALALPFACEGLSCFPSPPCLPVRRLVGLRGEGGEKGRERVRGLFKKKGKGGREGEGEGEGEGRGGRGEVEKVMMLSFGAHKFPVEDLEKWEVEEGWGVVIVREGGGEVGNERIVCVSNGWLREEGLLHVDVVAGCDCVVLKTGYGIVSEVLAHSIPCLYVPRPNFPEHQYLADALDNHTQALPISFEVVERGGRELFERAEGARKAEKKVGVEMGGMEDIAEFLMGFEVGMVLPEYV